MLLLPHVGNIKPFHKKSLKTIEEEVADYSKQIVNVETGHIYYKSQKDIDDIKRENEKLRELTEIRTNHYISNEEYSDSVKKVRELLDIEVSKSGILPSSNNHKSISATMYARHLKEQQLVNQGENV